jgi:excisionase family DNA binding protein
MPTHADPQFVSVGDFAQRTSLSVRHIWRLIALGQLPTLRLGRRRLLPFEAGVKALERLAATEDRDSTQPTH